MKKYFVILIFIILTLCLSSCSRTNVSTASITKKYEPSNVLSEWVFCGELKRPGYNMSIYYDTETKVMYACSGNGYTVLLNADGTPMLYEESK